MSQALQNIVVNLPMHFLASLLVMVVGWSAKSLSELSKNVQSLNIQMATIIEKINSHENRIYKLEEKGKKYNG